MGKSLSDRRWCRRLTTLFKILNGNTPAYLAEHIPVRSMITQSLRTRATPIPIARTERYQNSFFPYSLKMWNELSDDTRSKPSVTAFKHHLNSFIRPIGHSFFGVRDKIGLQLLTRIRVNFSDLREHRYNHNFNCINPTCACGNGEETSVHYILHCPRYTNHRITLLSKTSDIIASDVSVLPDEHLFHLLIYGSNVYNTYSNSLILKQTIIFIRKSKRFKTIEAFG